MKLHRDESGQAIILAALAIPCLVAMIGLGVDAGKLFNDRRTIQTAADAAALAGAMNLNNGTYAAAAKAASAANGYTDGADNTTVVINNGPTWALSNYKGQANYIEATVTKTESTIFMAVFGFSSVNVTARAVATNQAPGNGCVYTLGQTGTDLTVQGNLGINAPDCDFNIDSSSTNAVVETGKGGSVITSAVGVVGPISDAKNTYADFTPTPVGNVVPYSDPLATMQYPYTCTLTTGCSCPSASSICATNPDTSMPATCATTLQGQIKTTLTLSPGCYDLGGGASLSAQANVTMSPGVYFLRNGALNLQAGATLNGTSITMVMTGNSTITMGGSPNMNISAPDTSGTFPGILYYQVPSDTSPLTIIGSGTETIEGVFYAPTADITYQGSGGGTIYTDFVSKTLTLAGTPDFHSYAQLPGGAVAGMHAIALVE